MLNADALKSLINRQRLTKVDKKQDSTRYP